MMKLVSSAIQWLGPGVRCELSDASVTEVYIGFWRCYINVVVVNECFTCF